MADHAALAANIRALAHRRNLSEVRLADAAGISRGHMSMILGGKRNPSLATLEKLAVALDVPLRTLFGPCPKCGEW